MKNLVIVESPAKAKTIEKFLGPDFKVMSSYGHIRDLRKKDFSIDIDADFEPEYEVPAEKKELVAQLKSAAKKAETIWLASDEDREGEAIAWHLFEVLGLKPENTRRIVFHEITKPAILNAIEHPRAIDINLVNAQQARRVLDRIVGFELSPVLWKKIKPALSAGRVQSVAVRLICDREKEIEAFRPEPYFRVTGLFTTADGSRFKAELPHRVSNVDSARNLLEGCRSGSFHVAEISVKPLHRSPQPPYTTSTLQQDAHRRLGFSVNQTMMIAQKLYEDGKITYMRTDSLNLSELAMADIRNTIESEMGSNYYHRRTYHTKSKGAQEAHEAIRPTYLSHRTIEGSEREKRLYDLIWRRTMASQMADAQLEKTIVEISSDFSTAETESAFKAEGEVVKFDGFLRVYRPEESTDTTLLPSLVKGELLNATEITATERFTLAPPRYTEATLVKKMEDLGIGRPSTYAPTISTIQSRDYVLRGEKEGTPRNYRVLTMTDGVVSETTQTENSGSEKGKLVPTDVGMIVNEFLTQYFPDILDFNFTARIEEKFDEIAEGDLGWQKEISDFYVGFHPEIDRINSLRMEHKVGERLLGTDPKSGKPVSVKICRFGPAVQIGEATDEEKPRFASLLKDQSMATITLDEALKLFDLPRVVGESEGKEVVAGVGRFGPYIRFDGLFVSIPKDLTPETITLDESLQLVKEKREKEAMKLIKEFEEMPGLQVLNGRFGPYISYKPEGVRKAVNYRLPKDVEPGALTVDEVREIMKKQDESPRKTSGTKSTATKAKSKTSSKTTGAKKSTTKKTAAKS